MEIRKPNGEREIVRLPQDVEIGQRVRHIRKDILQLSQKEFAKEAGLGQSSISDYENGARSFPASALAILHFKYGVLPTYVTTGDLPIKKDSTEKPSATLTDMKELKSQYAALEAKLVELEKKFSYILKTKLK